MVENSSSKATDRNALAQYQRLRRIVLFIAIVLLGTGLLFVSSVWDDSKLHEYIETAGLLLIMAGVIGRIWSTLYIGGRKAATIVTEGPYSVMRNPLYFFSAIAAAGAGAQTGTITMALAFFVLTTLAFLIVIRREEAFLSGTFGQPYREYLQRVPRFFPKPSLFRDPQTIEVTLSRVYQTLLDGLVFLIALPLLEIVELLQKNGVLPILLRLY